MIYMFMTGWIVTGIITNINPFNFDRLSFNLCLCFLVGFIWQTVRYIRK